MDKNLRKMNEEQIIQYYKTNNTVKDLFKNLTKLLDETIIHNNTEEKDFRYEVFYKIKALFSLIEDEFKNQNEISDYKIFASKYKNEFDLLIKKTKEAAKRMKDRQSGYATFMEYAKILERKNK